MQCLPIRLILSLSVLWGFFSYILQTGSGRSVSRNVYDVARRVILIGVFGEGTQLSGWRLVTYSSNVRAGEGCCFIFSGDLHQENVFEWTKVVLNTPSPPPSTMVLPVPLVHSWSTLIHLGPVRVATLCKLRTKVNQRGPGGPRVLSSSVLDSDQEYYGPVFTFCSCVLQGKITWHFSPSMSSVSNRESLLSEEFHIRDYQIKTSQVARGYHSINLVYHGYMESIPGYHQMWL